MKKKSFILIILSVVILQISCSKSDDNQNETDVSLPEKIYQGSLINPSIEELESFYEIGYDAVSGDVIFDSIDNIINLQPLSNLKQISGNFVIMNNMLETMDGLEGLYSIGAKLKIAYCPLLKDLKGLGSLMTIDSSMILIYCHSITNLNGLNNLKSIGGLFHIVGNNNLTNLIGLEKLASVDGFCWISYNDLLSSIDGLEALREVKNLSIESNIKLADFCAIKSLLKDGEVAGNVVIAYNKFNPSPDDIIAGFCSQ